MTLRGSVETIGLVDLFQVIQGNGHTGTLKVQVGEQVQKLHFYKGQLYLPTGGAKGALKIGALLVKAKKITGKELLRALQLQSGAAGGEKLGEVLVQEGLVQKAELDALVRRLFEEDIYDLLFKEGAYFEWKKDVLPANFADARGQIKAMNFDTRSILMEASRRQDEWRRIRARIPSTKAIYRLARAGESPVESAEDVIESSSSDEGIIDEEVAVRVVDALKKAGAVLPRGGSVLGRSGEDSTRPLEDCPFDGRRSVDEVVALTSMNTFEGLGTIARLRDEGLVLPVAAPEIEPRALEALAQGRAVDAYKLFVWSNEVERLRAIASALDKELLKPDALRAAGRPAFACRTAGTRALQVLSRLLRRGAPFQFHARAEESTIEVYVMPRLLRLHLTGPRRTHSAQRYLRARGVISEADLRLARDISKRSGRDIDRVLVEDKLVSREQWLLAVKDKVVSSLFSIFEWSDTYVEVSTDPSLPPSSDEVRGLVVEIPLDEDLREDLRKDLLRWKAIVEAVPSVDVIFTCTRPTRGESKKTHDLLDGRRAVADLLALAKVAPLELVRFLLEALLDHRIRRLTDTEHAEKLEAAVEAGRLDDAIAYAKSAIAFGFSPDDYRRRILELREMRKGMPSAEGRPTVQGELGQVSLAEVLQLLHQGKRTGTLRITAGEQEKTFYLDQGQVYILSIEGPSPDKEVEDLLGESASERLGLLALGGLQGAIDEAEVEKAKIDQIKNDLFSAFLWDGARFEFLQNVLPPELRADSPGSTKLALRTEALLFEAMQRLAEWDEMRKSLKSSHAVFRFATSDAKADAISSSTGALAYLFDGEHALSDIVRRSGEDRYAVYRFAYGLVQKGKLVFSHLKTAPAPTDRPAKGENSTPTARIITSARVQKPEPSDEKVVPPAGRGYPGLQKMVGDRSDDSMTEIDRVPSTAPDRETRSWGRASPLRNEVPPEIAKRTEARKAPPEPSPSEELDEEPPPPPKKKLGKASKNAKRLSGTKKKLDAGSPPPEQPKPPEPPRTTRRWGAPPS